MNNITNVLRISEDNVLIHDMNFVLKFEKKTHQIRQKRVKIVEIFKIDFDDQ